MCYVFVWIIESLHSIGAYHDVRQKIGTKNNSPHTTHNNSKWKIELMQCKCIIWSRPHVILGVWQALNIHEEYFSDFIVSGATSDLLITSIFISH